MSLQNWSLRPVYLWCVTLYVEIRLPFIATLSAASLKLNYK